MADRGLQEIGQRIRELRLWRGMTQDDLVAACGVPIAVIKKLEQGRGGARMENYHAIARALNVATLWFMPKSSGAPTYADVQDDRHNILLADMHNAILPPMGLNGPMYREMDDVAPNIGRLRSGAQTLFEAYQSNRYDTIAHMAPGLIRSAQYHVDVLPSGQDAQDARRLRGELLQFSGQYLTQVGELELALVAFDKALKDAPNESVGATMIGGQAWPLLRQARFVEVEQICVATADAIEPKMSSPSAEALGAWGRLLMTAAAAASRNNRRQEARDYLSMAEAAAARVGREMRLAVNVVFGPYTVYMRRVQIELIGGNPGSAIELCGRPPISSGTPNPTNLQRYQLDHAHALALTGHADKAADLLEGLRRKAPEWLRHQRFARDVMRGILRTRKRSYTSQQRGLANFLGLEP